MELFQLEAFLAVVREGSFSAAAKALYRTQPAISQTIKKLEDEIGRPLFDRSSRRGVLTDAFREPHRELKIDMPLDALVSLVIPFNVGIMVERLGGIDTGHAELLEWIDGWLSR